MPKHIWLHFTATDLNTELQQLADEGRDLSGLQDEIDWLSGCDFDTPEAQTRFNAFMDAAQQLPDDPSEPNGLEEIRALRPAAPAGFGEPPSDLEDRVLGAWLGRTAGCLLGKPIEGMRSRVVYPILKSSDNFPLHRYLHSEDGGAGTWRAAFGIYAYSEDFLIDRIDGAPEDDDTNYTVTALSVIKKHGRDFTTEHVGDFWMENIPALHTCTAERAAYRNLMEGFLPPETAARRNPYREWIGAQIRADYWGYVNPGDPEAAAAMAWRDARLSHVKNGIYGAMWAAAMLASAFVVQDPRQAIEGGLGQIPEDCRLARALRRTIRWHEEGITYRQAVDRVMALYDEDNWHQWTHTITNAVIVAIGLLWGEGSYAETICKAVEAMYDTDCNGATAGSVIGAMHGASRLPSEWIDPIDDRLETGVKGFAHTRLSELARITLTHMSFSR